jgi:hypothetical protein
MLSKNDRLNAFVLWLYVDQLKDTHETVDRIFQPVNTDVEANTVC